MSWVPTPRLRILLRHLRSMTAWLASPRTEIRIRCAPVAPMANPIGFEPSQLNASFGLPRESNRNRFV